MKEKHWRKRDKVTTKDVISEFQHLRMSVRMFSNYRSKENVSPPTIISENKQDLGAITTTTTVNGNKSSMMQSLGWIAL